MGSNAKIHFPQGADRMRIEQGGFIERADGLGAVAGTGVSLSTERGEIWHKTTITITDLSITITDATTVGAHGSQKIYDFPEGVIVVEAAMMNLTTLAGSGGIGDTAALIGALGSAAAGTNNETLTTTEADIIASTAGTLSGGAGTLVGVGPGSGLNAKLDGHTTPADVYLNIVVPDAGSSASDTVVVSGTIVLLWLNLGDF